MLVAEYDRRNGWSDGATQSCAHWLNWKCGIAMGAAREKVRVARALENLPKVSAAMASGRLSYSKVREITRVASAETEDYLLMIAEHGTARTWRRLVRAYRRCQEAEELSREARQQQNRRVSFRYDDDGSLILNCRLPAEAGAKIMKALELAVEELPVDPPTTFQLERCRTGSVQRAPRGRPRPAWPRASSRMACWKLPARIASRSWCTSPPRHCAIAPPVVAKSSTALPSPPRPRAASPATQASSTLIEDEDGEPLNVGRKTRTISAPLRRVLNARDKGCRFPGCCNARYIDTHHIEHWANGGETKPSNLVSLCRFHHRAVHEGGIRIEILDDGALRFVKPNGRPSIASCPAARSRSAIGSSCRPARW